jgi:phosphoglycolate phosphatase-like HAD superfamily hydrolase
MVTEGRAAVRYDSPAVDRIELLALDFDGVISDSAPESVVVAMRTYLALRGDSRLRAGRDPLLSRGVPDRAAIDADALYSGFVDLIPLGNRAEDYAVVLSALDERRAIRGQAEYDAYRSGFEATWLREFHRLFYRERAVLARSDPTRWYALMRPYPEVLAALRRRHGGVTLAVATAKDRRSVGNLLRHYGIDDLFAPDLVLDKETGVRKSAHLEHLHSALGVAYPRIAFIDDKVNHLDDVTHLGVRCGLAAWGYNGPREITHARERGHLVLNLADFEAQLFG